MRLNRGARTSRKRNRLGLCYISAADRRKATCEEGPSLKVELSDGYTLAHYPTGEDGQHCDVSVVVCTRNRSQQLTVCLSALQRQSYPAARFRIIVVDNASDDTTRATVEDAARQTAAPGIAYLLEGRVGVSHARNTGIHNATGKIIAFVDDDAVPEPQWLAGLMAAHAQFPSAGAVGGAVLPMWGATMPSWFSKEMEPVVSIYNPLDTVGAVSQDQYPRGGNCSFLREVLMRVGGFEPVLGRVGTSLVSNEEIDASARVAGAGFDVLYTPHAVVRHPVSAAKLTRSYFRRRLYWQGVSDRLMDYKRQGPQSVAERRLGYAKLLTRWIPRTLVARLAGTESVAFLLEIQCWQMVGYLLGGFRLPRG